MLDIASSFKITDSPPLKPHGVVKPTTGPIVPSSYGGFNMILRVLPTSVCGPQLSSRVTIPPILRLVDGAMASGKKMKRRGCVEQPLSIYTHVAISSWYLHVARHRGTSTIRYLCTHYSPPVNLPRLAAPERGTLRPRTSIPRVAPPGWAMFPCCFPRVSRRFREGVTSAGKP
jgi:hypothetical protein